MVFHPSFALPVYICFIYVLFITYKSKTTKIPKIILQTYHTDKLHNVIQDHIDSFLAINNDYKHYLITDEIGIQLIKDNFDDNVLDAFLKLNIGAAKGDFLRYTLSGVYTSI